MKNKATVEFYDAQKGGRITPPIRNYKPQMKVGCIMTSCRITPVDKNVEIMHFNLKHVVYIELQFEELYQRLLYEGMEIELYEGSKLVGKGVIEYIEQK